MEALACDVCGYAFDGDARRPKIVPCGHTFCLACLQDSGASSGTTCPNDRRHFPAEPAELLDNFYLLSRLETVTETRTDSQSLRTRRTALDFVRDVVGEREVVGRWAACREEARRLRLAMAARALRREALTLDQELERGDYEQALQDMGGMRLDSDPALLERAVRTLGEAAAACRDKLPALERELDKLRRDHQQQVQDEDQHQEAVGVTAGQGLDEGAGEVPSVEQLLFDCRRWLERVEQQGEPRMQEQMPPCPTDNLPALEQLSLPLSLMTSAPTEHLDEKRALLPPLRRFQLLIGLHCYQDPAWALQLLRGNAAHLGELELWNGQRDHLLALEHMPGLQRLRLLGSKTQKENPVLFQRLPVKRSTLLRVKLDCDSVPALTVRSLLAAHRHTLSEVTLLVRADRDLQEAGLEQDGLQEGCTLKLDRYCDYETTPECGSQLAKTRRLLPGVTVLCWDQYGPNDSHV